MNPENRKQQWDKIEKIIRKELPKKEVAYIKRIFFDEDFELGNKEKYGSYANSLSALFLYHPIKTRDRWGYFVKEIIPKTIRSHDFDVQFPSHVGGLSQIDAELSDFGWSMEEEIDVIRYVFGEKYLPSNYEIEGVQCRNPYSAMHFFSVFRQNLSLWFRGSYSQQDIKWAHLLELWSSSFPYLYSEIYGFKYSNNSDVARAQFGVQDMVYTLRNFNIDELEQTLTQDKDYKLKFQDCGLREKCVEEIISIIESPETPKEFRALWELSADPEFKPNDVYSYDDPEDAYLDPDNDSGLAITERF